MEGGEFNGDNSFEQGFQVLMKFETLRKSKALNSLVTKLFVILDACQH